MKKRIIATVLTLCMTLLMTPMALAAGPTLTGVMWQKEKGSVQTAPNISTELAAGDIRWDLLDGYNQYQIKLFKDGAEIDEKILIYSVTGSDSLGVSSLMYEKRREPGTYYFTVQALGDGGTLPDSEIAQSDEWTINPTETIGTPTNLRWDGANAQWDPVENAEQYNIFWYYSKTADGEFQEVEYSATLGFDGTSHPLNEWVTSGQGAGFYRFEVQALTSDPEKFMTGEISEMSPVYSTEGVTTESINIQLGNILNSDSIATPQAIQDAVAKLDQEDLSASMLTDPDTVTTLQKLESKTKINVETSVDAGLGLNENDITILGAALNAGKDVSKVTLKVGKPAAGVTIPSAYQSSIQFDFTLDGAGKDQSGEFVIPIKVKMPVPEAISNDDLHIVHYNSNSQKWEEIQPLHFEEDAGTRYVSFITRSFSPFVFVNAVAQMGDVYYETYADAVKDAQNNAIITILVAPDAGETIDVGDKAIQFKAGQGVTLQANMFKGTVTSSADGSFTVAPENTEGDGSHNNPGGGTSSGGSGSSGSSNYSLNVSSSSHGTVDVSHTNAGRGATITLTVKPDTGYELNALTVTDADGDSISLTQQENNKYTFTMPASRVTISASFAPMQEPKPEPSSLPFTDISTEDWYAEAVKFVYDNGLMAGTSDTTFSPNETTTRGMIVTILYRLEGEPAAVASNFQDVPAGQYYADAVAWASANGIVSGYGDGLFGPNDTITREQMASILYRYAQYKDYDVTASNDLSGFTDVSSVNSYAASAMQWANAEDLITGVSSTKLDPQGSAIRAQVASILMRFIQNIAQA